MEFTELGNTGIRASRLGIGCSHIASVGSSQPPAEIRATLAAALDAGINFFDTASVYGQGDSERMLGRLFGPRRDEVLFCTKAGLRLSVSQKAVRLAKPVLRAIASRKRSVHQAGQSARQKAERSCFESEFLERELEGSLRRLRTDRVDLFLLHSPPVSLAKDAALGALLERVVQSGKARAAGVSCANAEDAEAWAAVPGVACVQVPLPANAPPFSAPSGIGVIAREVLAGRGDTPPAATLQIALSRPTMDVVLTRVSSRAHLAENLTALKSSS